MTALSGSIQLRAKTAAQWVAYATPPLDRQPCVESDTGQLKIGDGVTLFGDLPYVGNSSMESSVNSGGTITVETIDGTGTNNDIRVTAATYFISGSGSYSANETTFLNIALAAAGTQRYIGIYGTTSNTITKVEGSEAALATLPSQPANTVLIGYVLVSDAAVAPSTTPSTIDPVPTDGSSNAVSSNGVFDALAVVSAAALTSMVWSFPIFNPADSQTYWIFPYTVTVPFVGGTGDSTAPNVVPKTGRIKLFTITERHSLTPTNENSTFRYKINAGAWVNFTTTFKFTGGIDPQVVIASINVDIPVTKGDYIMISWITPAWVTNPTQVHLAVSAFIA